MLREEVGRQNETMLQLAFADKILLNKTDLISAEEADTIEAVVHAINPRAEVLSDDSSNTCSSAFSVHASAQPIDHRCHRWVMLPGDYGLRGRIAAADCSRCGSAGLACSWPVKLLRTSRTGRARH